MVDKPKNDVLFSSKTEPSEYSELSEFSEIILLKCKQ
jgi:hypothetical protein